VKLRIAQAILNMIDDLITTVIRYREPIALYLDQLHEARVKKYQLGESNET
jgi:hypothetical protein